MDSMPASLSLRARVAAGDQDEQAAQTVEVFFARRAASSAAYERGKSRARLLKRGRRLFVSESWPSLRSSSMSSNS